MRFVIAEVWRTERVVGGAPAGDWSEVDHITRPHEIDEVSDRVCMDVPAPARNHPQAPRFAHEKFDVGEAYLVSGRNNPRAVEDGVAPQLVVPKDAYSRRVVGHWPRVQAKKRAHCTCVV